MTSERVDELVRISLSDLISHDIDWLNDYVSEAITGSRVGLEDIGYEPASVDGDAVVLRVSGEVSNSD